MAFRSSASNLASGDSNGAADIFISDRVTGTVTRVSVDGAGAQANASSFSPSVSGDGRYVAFRSSASNLVSGDNNAADDIFVRDQTTGTTTRVSVDSAGAQANASSSSPAISGNGLFVAFQSSASNLVAGDTNSATDVFVRSLAGATTTRVSVGSSGNQASAPSSSPSVSFDGSRIAFASTASLASADGNLGNDIYVRDRIANTTTWAMAWVKTGWWGTTGAGTSPAISGDGRYVAFALDADVHIADINRARDIYEYDLATGAWAHISRDDLRGGGDKASDLPSLSSDGTYAAFESSATNFHVDTNGVADAFVHKWSGATTAASDSSAAESSATTSDATAQQQPLPRACSLSKDAVAIDEPSIELSTNDSADAPIAATNGIERLSCRVTPVPPPVKPALPTPPYPVPPLPCIFWPELCLPEGGSKDFEDCTAICNARADQEAMQARDQRYEVIYTDCVAKSGDHILCSKIAEKAAEVAYEETRAMVFAECMAECLRGPTETSAQAHLLR